MTDLFRSLFTREREFPSRVKTELENRERERLVSITQGLSKTHNKAKSNLMDEVGISKIQDIAPNGLKEEIILNGETMLVLSYMEHLLNAVYEESHKTYPDVSKSRANEIFQKVSEVLETEGLLWELVFEDDNFKFRKIESEAMEDIDQKIQALAEEEPWGDALKGYNEAFNRYLEGKYDEQIPKKLYYSMEEVLKIICVDEEGWTDNRELVHSEYLDMMKDHDFYHSHGATSAELNQLLESLKTMVAKISDDRKQRHAWHDRTYATLLIHQVGAYLYFLINRHKEITN